MNLRISALEKVARIGCKYDLSFLLYSCWALPSGGFAEGQLALSSLRYVYIHVDSGKQGAAAAVAGTAMYKLSVMSKCSVFLHTVFFKKAGKLSEPLQVLR